MTFSRDNTPEHSARQASFHLEGLNAQLAGTSFAGSVHHLPTVGSTNTVAIEAAQQGRRTGVWVADEQTAGRGRGGHGWHSEVGEGLYVSILLRPRLAGVDVLKLSLAAGLAARAAVLECSRLRPERVDLRWPNDLMLWGADGVERKFGGILTESGMHGGTGTLAYAVAGIGMNLNHREMPEELRAIATSLRIETGEQTAREPLLAHLLRRLEAEVNAVEQEADGLLPAHERSLAERFGDASSWIGGLEVEVAEDDGYTGVTAGLDRHGLLQVRLEDGSVRVVRHGGVRRRMGSPVGVEKGQACC